MELQSLGRMVLILGVILAVVGGILIFAGKIPLLGRLPGDLVFRKGGLTIFAPIVTMVLLSMLLTLTLSLFSRWFR